jgi:hypothetical protein
MHLHCERRHLGGTLVLSRAYGKIRTYPIR